MQKKRLALLLLKHCLIFITCTHAASALCICGVIVHGELLEPGIVSSTKGTDVVKMLLTSPFVAIIGTVLMVPLMFVPFVVHLFTYAIYKRFFGKIHYLYYPLVGASMPFWFAWLGLWFNIMKGIFHPLLIPVGLICGYLYYYLDKIWFKRLNEN